MADELPPINEWWPHLSIDTRNLLLEYPSAPLVGTVRQEIANATGALIDDGATLSERDVQYIRTQTEPVD